MAKVKIEDAARLMQVNPNFIRVGLQEKRLTFGEAVKTSSIWSYHISPHLFRDYIGPEEYDKYFKEKDGE